MDILEFKDLEDWRLKTSATHSKTLLETFVSLSKANTNPSAEKKIRDY